MAVVPICILPDPVLRQKSNRVRNIDGSVHKLIDNLLDTMYSAPGAGLAAPQIGVPLRVIVVRQPSSEEEDEDKQEIKQEKEDIVLINPEIVKEKGECEVQEGCLSVPGYVGQIKRAESVTVKGRDRKGKEFRIKADGFLAQVLQHEIDHLNGVLYIDRLENLEMLRKLGQDEEDEQV